MLAHRGAAALGKPSWGSELWRRSLSLCGESLWCRPHTASLPICISSPESAGGPQRSPAIPGDGRIPPANHREASFDKATRLGSPGSEHASREGSEIGCCCSLISNGCTDGGNSSQSSGLAPSTSRRRKKSLEGPSIGRARGRYTKVSH